MPNGVIGNTTDSGSVKSRFEPWLGNKQKIEMSNDVSIFFLFFLSNLFVLLLSLRITIFGSKSLAESSMS